MGDDILIVDENDNLRSNNFTSSWGGISQK